MCLFQSFYGSLLLLVLSARGSVLNLQSMSQWQAFFIFSRRFSLINIWESSTGLFKVQTIIYAKIDQCSNMKGQIATHLIDLRLFSRA